MIKKTTFLKIFLCCSILFSSFTASSQDVFINEIHYDNDGADTDEGIEIAGTAGTDLTGWSLVLYNGNNGAEYNTVSLSGVLTDTANGFGFIFTPIPGIQNGSPDGIALVNASAQVVQFLSYEGSFTAVGGPADGLISEDIGVSEPSNSPVGFSLQLSGQGTTYSDFQWGSATASTYGAVNNNQVFGIPVPNVFINEIHYDNAGADVNEAIEIAGEVDIDLTGWSVVLYNGSNGTVYDTAILSETFTDSGSGFGFVVVPFTQIQNGSPDGVALVNVEGEIIQFLSYEGSFTATDGPASGLTSVDIGVAEPSDSPIGFSLQLAGEGLNYEDFVWAEAAPSTYGAVNNNQVLGEPVPNVFVNEFHYDNDGADSDEIIELAGEAGTDISGWSLVLYNGSNGEVYNAEVLSGVFNDTTNGFGFITVPFSSIQNGPDAIALVNSEGEVIQFLSYEGSFTAVGGPADGMASEDIGIAESSTTPVGNSLQLTGTGLRYDDFSWSAIPSTFGTLNTGQSFGDVTDPGEVELMTIAEARLLPQGTMTRIRGVLTASDQLGGPAFIKDGTAGIPVFDEAVHGEGLYEIGDELEIVGALSQFNAMIQLGSVTEVVVISEGNEVVPVVTTINGLATLEGQLVFIDDIVFETGGRLTVGNHEVSDATGTVEIRIDNDVESLIGRRKPNEVTTLTGVVGSFNGALQVFPRFEPDLPGTEEFVIEPPAGEDIPKEDTFDVATWNMEFFGSALSGFGPSDIELQKLNALRVIDSLKADIIAVQEVSDIDFLAQALSEHTTANYAVICSDVYSYSFEPDDGTFPPQQLCFIYNTGTVSIVDERVVFEAFYTAARTGQITDLNNYPTGSPQSFWSSGRLPYMITAEVNILGATETIKLVNVHGKSGSSPEDIARKTYDYSVLKDTLDTYYANDKLILLGDYNDDVDVSIGGGPTPLMPFVTDVSNYDIVSSSFSYDGQNSTVYFSDVIDHTTITDELFGPYIEDSEYLLDPRDFIAEYGNTTSDHFPSRVRFILEGVPVEPLVVTLPESITLYRGYEGMSSALLSVEIEGGLEPYLVEWSNGLTGQEIEVTVDDEGELTLLITDGSGLEVEKSIYIEVEDVSCSKGWFSGVQMCFRGKMRCVPEHLVEHFLSKGYVLGECYNTYPKMVVKASPNPFYNNLNLEFYSETEGLFNVEVINYFGQVVYNTDLEIMPGHTVNSLDLSYLWRGLYLIKITEHNNPTYCKILKVFKR